MDQPVEECPGGYDDGRGGNRAAVAQADATANAGAFQTFAAFGIAGGKLFDEQSGNLGLLELEIRLALENLAHLEPVLLLVALRAGRPHGGTARGVEQAELNADGVGDLAHDAAQGIDFAHQVSFGNAADRGIAGHLRDQIHVEREQRGAKPQARRRYRGLAAGVAGADNDYVVLLGVLQTATLHRRKQSGFPILEGALEIPRITILAARPDCGTHPKAFKVASRALLRNNERGRLESTLVVQLCRAFCAERACATSQSLPIVSPPLDYDFCAGVLRIRRCSVSFQNPCCGPVMLTTNLEQSRSSTPRRLQPQCVSGGQ